MNGFGPPDDESTCSYCGCDVEVIGPPGPQHRDGCPSKEVSPEERPDDLLVVDFEGDDWLRPLVKRRDEPDSAARPLRGRPGRKT